MPPEPSPPDSGIAVLVARAVGHGNAAYLGDNKAEQLCSWLFDALSQIYWLHDPANPDADTDAVPAGRVRVITLAGTWEDVGTHSHMIQTRISAIDALTPLTPVDGRAPVPESGDFVVFVQVTDRSRVVLSTSLVMPRDPCVLFGNWWGRMCELFPEGEPQRAMVPAFTTTLRVLGARMHGQGHAALRRLQHVLVLQPRVPSSVLARAQDLQGGERGAQGSRGGRRRERLVTGSRRIRSARALFRRARSRTSPAPARIHRRRRALSQTRAHTCARL